MKALSPKLMLLTLILLYFATSCSTVKPITDFTGKTITVTLFVDAKTLDEYHLTKSCSLQAVYSDGSIKPIGSDGNLECFTVYADVEDIIIWKGQTLSNENDEEVNIERIKQLGNVEVFQNRKLYGKRSKPSLSEVVTAGITKDTKDKDDYKYEIRFELNGKTYTIDPKIKVGSQILLESPEPRERP